jgi:hypothetical protein
MTGFEPATSGSTIRRSNQLSYTHHEGKKDDINKAWIVVATDRVVIGHESHSSLGEERLFVLNEYDY